jgi:hypothetical protein
MTGSGSHDDLVASIEDGVYMVPTLDVADAILESWAMTDVVREFLAGVDQSGSTASASDDANR